MINIAYADQVAAQAPTGASMLTQMLPFLLILFFFWLFIIRPQSKRLNEHRQMIAAIKRGDKVVLDSGIIGEVMKVQDHYFVVEIDDEVQVKVLKHKVENLYDPVAYQMQAQQAQQMQAKVKEDPKKDKKAQTPDEKE